MPRYLFLAQCTIYSGVTRELVQRAASRNVRLLSVIAMTGVGQVAAVTSISTLFDLENTVVLSLMKILCNLNTQAHYGMAIIEMLTEIPCQGSPICPSVGQD